MPAKLAPARSGYREYLLSFSKWKTYLIACFFVYLAGFYLSPDRDFHMRWFYYTITAISVFMLLIKGREIFSGDRSGNLRFVAIITLLFFLPFLWTPDADYQRTVRHGIERLLFVFSFVLATYYCCRREKLVERYIPLLLVASASIALILFFYRTALYPDAIYKTGMLILSSNPNQTGMPMGVASILCLSLWLCKDDLRGRRLIWLALSLLFAAGVAIAATRSAMLGLLAAVAMLLYIRTDRKVFIVAPLVALMAVVALLFFYYSNPVQHLLPGRSAIWAHIWETFRDHPWFGQGAKSTYMVIRGPCGLCDSDHAKLEAHSLYFGIAYYAGIYGIVVLLVLLGKTLRNGLAATKEIQTLYLPLLIYGLAVHAFEGIYPLYKPNPFWLFTWLPILVLLFSRESNGAARESSDEL